jgi:hypothetical protein
VTVDSFDSWFERWSAEGDMPASASGIELNGLRSAVARHEHDSVLLCDRLVGAFCARNLHD